MLVGGAAPFSFGLKEKPHKFGGSDCSGPNAWLTRGTAETNSIWFPRCFTNTCLNKWGTQEKGALNNNRYPAGWNFERTGQSISYAVPGKAEGPSNNEQYLKERYPHLTFPVNQPEKEIHLKQPASLPCDRAPNLTMAHLAMQESETPKWLVDIFRPAEFRLGDDRDSPLQWQFHMGFPKFSDTLPLGTLS